MVRYKWKVPSGNLPDQTIDGNHDKILPAGITWALMRSIPFTNPTLIVLHLH